MKIVLEESDLMRIVEEHVSQNPFFNLDGKEVNVELNNEEGQPVEVTVYIEDSTEPAEKAPIKRRARRTSTPTVRKTEPAQKAVEKEVAKTEDEAADEALDKQQLAGIYTDEKPPFEADAPKAVEEEMSPSKPLSKSLFA